MEGLVDLALNGITSLFPNPLVDITSAFVINELLCNSFLTNITAMSLLLQLLGLEKYGPVTTHKLRDEYDYVIVGGGSAGSALAARLSEVQDVSVALLEAGGDPLILSEVPLFSYFVLGSHSDWNYKTVPQKNTGRSLKNQQIFYNAGKALGGSSSINAMIYVRGNRKNYDSWAASGAEGWSYEEVLPYFKKLEDIQNTEFADSHGGAGYHGHGGPITASQPPYRQELKEAVLKAAEELNYPIVDSNGEQQKGFFPHYGSVRKGKRCSTAKGYLAAVDHRQNLDIAKNAFVNKVIFEGNRAVGVEVDFKGRRRTIRARKEVIMSAGAVNSAKLLMLSGIGPREELDKFQIPVIADLPVGRNLQDHLSTVMSYHQSPKIPHVIVKGSHQIPDYLLQHTGILSSTFLISVLAFLSKNEDLSEDTLPDYEIYFLESPILSKKYFLNMKDETFRAYYLPHTLQSGVTCFSQQLNPRSRGTVTLQSTNPRDSPLIDPNYLAVEEDADDMVQGLKKCNEIAKTKAMRDIGVRRWENKLPECAEYNAESDEYLRCYVGSLTHSIWHPVGTAKMGRADDPTTVVDPQLRVKGIEGLRVVDASIMPQITTGNTNIPTIMIAEKAADMIKETLNSSPRNCAPPKDKKNNKGIIFNLLNLTVLPFL